MDCAEQPRQINKTEIIELRNNANSTRLSIDVEKNYPPIISQRIRTYPDYWDFQSELCHPRITTLSI
ncbi:MAG: hypothetical protein NVSMB58_16860 [Terriglobales bacterium]